MHSTTQPHYFEADNIDIIQQSNGGDFITVLLICFVIAIICACPVLLTESSSNKSK